MKKVFPVEMSGFPKPLVRPAGVSPEGFKFGRIEKILEPGRFVVALDNGTRVNARGLEALKVGARVRAFPPGGLPDAGKSTKDSKAPLLLQSGSQWEAFIPLGFGGKNSSARLQVFVERKAKDFWKTNIPAVYLVFWTRTENQGEIQWSVYLKGQQVFLQVYSQPGLGGTKNLEDLIANVEGNLKSRGFMFVAPTVRLKKPFNIPQGFRLSLKG